MTRQFEGNKHRYIRMQKLLVCLLVLMAGKATAQYQTRAVHGVVQDSTGLPLVGVNVRLVSVIDTLLTVTDERGKFQFRSVYGLEFRVIFSLLGYQISERHQITDPLKWAVDMGKSVLKPQINLLKEVVVYNNIPVQMMEDTIQYNASAFPVRAGALTEELLRQLPGLQVNRDGKVTAQGQTVAHVKVNGRPFFGGDVLTATRNLPANIVDHIQVINDYGDEANITGIKNTESEKIINIVLKKDRNKGMFGQVTAGGGTTGRYIGSFSANRFDNGQELSLLGSLNNTNTSIFSFGDVRSGSERDRSGFDLGSMFDQTDGINTAGSFGVNFADEYRNGVTIAAGYNFVDKKNVTEGTSLLQSIFQNNSIFSNEERKTNSENARHKISAEIEAKIDTFNYFKIAPTVTFSESDDLSNSISNIRNKWLTTNRLYNTTSHASSPDVDLDIFYNRRFKKPGRNFILNLQGQYNKRNKKDYINDLTRNIDSSTFNDPFIDTVQIGRRMDDGNRNRVGFIQASYLEPINDRSLLEFAYEFSNTSISSIRNTWDTDPEGSIGNSVYIDSLSIDYAYLFQTSKFGLNYQFNQNNRYKYTIGFAMQPTTLSGYTLNKDSVTSYKHMNVIPSAGFYYKINRYSDLSINYLGRNNQPNFSQIQPVRDVSDPQNEVDGNAHLKAEFINNFQIKYNTFSLVTGSMFNTTLSFNLIQNKIVTKRSIVPNSTKQETGYLNTDGYFDMRGDYIWSFPLVGETLKLTLNGNATFSNNISYINEERNLGRILDFSQGAQLGFQLADMVDAEFSTNYAVTRTRNSLPYTADVDASFLNVNFGGKGYLGEKWTLGIDFSQRVNAGFSSSVNSNPTLLNAYIERSFLKNNRALLRLQGFDLFNENTGISREVVGNDVLDTRNNRLARYFMITLNIRLQKYPSKPSKI
ncbi:CarboxypepD_reg-like domain-containing protein [bacterium A37T11]|nr:CarboxypepD_reg-like domain-containing protein [bacterium A37T11]